MILDSFKSCKPFKFPLTKVGLNIAIRLKNNIYDINEL